MSFKFFKSNPALVIKDLSSTHYVWVDEGTNNFVVDGALTTHAAHGDGGMQGRDLREAFRLVKAESLRPVTTLALRVEQDMILVALDKVEEDVENGASPILNVLIHHLRRLSETSFVEASPAAMIFDDFLFALVKGEKEFGEGELNELIELAGMVAGSAL